MIQYECVKCGSELESPESLAGQVDTCPVCRTPNRVPQLPPATPPIPTPPPPPPPSRRPVSARTFISPMTRATVASICFAIVIALNLGLLSSCQEALGLLKRVEADRQSISRSELSAFDDRSSSISSANILFSLTGIVLFFCWKYRAYKNLVPLHADRIRMSPGGSVGWYFCPIANFWKPCQAMMDIWSGSRPSVTSSGRGDSGALVGLWWTAWIGSALLGMYVSVASAAAKAQVTFGGSTSQLQSALKLAMFGVAISMISTALTVAIIWVVSRRQVERHRALAFQGGTATGSEFQLGGGGG